MSIYTPAPTTPDQLCEAFAEFEDASHQLSTFYRDLEHRVAALADELALSRAEQARDLAEKERLAARLENLLEALPGGVVVIDQHGCVQEFNPAATELLGPIDAGETWSAVVSRAFAPRWDDGHDISLEDGRVVNIATQALSSEPGQILLIKDVSETRRLQDQLAHHKRISAQTEMAAAMAHQIRTPLASVLLNTGNIRRAVLSEQDRERAIERALKSLRKLERLVNDMLLFARGGNLDVEKVGVDELLADIEIAAADTFASGDFEIEVQQGSNGGAIYANVAALTSISLNLIENSYDACNGVGRICIRSLYAEDMFALVFDDDGPGVEVADIEKVFEPFHSTRTNGTGLGLSVARAIARAHAGDLRADADVYTGARFVMKLPLIETIGAARRRSEPEPLNVPEAGLPALALGPAG